MIGSVVSQRSSPYVCQSHHNWICPGWTDLTPLRQRLVKRSIAEGAGFIHKCQIKKHVTRVKPSSVAACKEGFFTVFGGSLSVSLSLPMPMPMWMLASPPPACFDSSCQSSKDFLFLVSLLGPVFLFMLVSVWILNRSSALDNTKNDSDTFMDPETGVVFESPKGTEPARDRYGELAFKAISWTPWPVDSKTQGEAVRLEVGPVGSKVPRTFIFEKRYLQKNMPSVIVVTQLERPLGIVFEEGPGGEARVAELIPGGNADRLMRQTSLDPALSKMAPRVGDILRACTATNVVYQTGALLFGAQRPQRTIVVYGADEQRWPNVAAALTRGLVADGKVTLVLERCLDPQGSDD